MTARSTNSAVSTRVRCPMTGPDSGSRRAAFLSRRAPEQVVGGALSSEGSVRGAELRTLTRQAMADPEQRRLILEVALTVNTAGERKAGGTM
jgi:hypothetical protein